MDSERALEGTNNKFGLLPKAKFARFSSERKLFPPRGGRKKDGERENTEAASARTSVKLGLGRARGTRERALGSEGVGARPLEKRGEPFRSSFLAKLMVPPRLFY